MNAYLRKLMVKFLMFEVYCAVIFIYINMTVGKSLKEADVSEPIYLAVVVGVFGLAVGAALFITWIRLELDG